MQSTLQAQRGELSSFQDCCCCIHFFFRPRTLWAVDPLAMASNVETTSICARTGLPEKKTRTHGTRASWVSPPTPQTSPVQDRLPKLTWDRISNCPPLPLISSSVHWRYVMLRWTNWVPGNTSMWPHQGTTYAQPDDQAHHQSYLGWW